MKAHFRKYFNIHLSRHYLAAAALLSSLPGAQAATPSELDSFAENIESSFEGRCTGFGYAIFDNGNYVRGGGNGFRYKSDHPLTQLPFDQNTQKDCHSMSKTITAAAMIRALQIRGIGLDARIYDYFPEEFQNITPGISTKLITFQQLLSHQSGFGDSAKTWSELRNELQSGPDYALGSDTVYSNWNYGMCRLLIPYVLYTNEMREIEGTVTSSQLSAGCADLYINFTRDWILKPAGAHATRTRPPQNPQSVNFSYLYSWNDHDAEGIMPDRRLNIGSGGWAMSAKEYGKFLSALYNGEILNNTVKVGNAWENTIDYMKANNLGMWTIRGSSNEIYYQHTGANSYSGNSGTYGGQSVWMHYPTTNLCAVVQINCNANEITAAGVPRHVAIQEDHDEVFTTPAPSESAYMMNIFCSRIADGTIISRGLSNSGNPGERNFDTQAETNRTLTRFFETSQQTFMLRYNPDNGQSRGTLSVQKVNPDGTLGSVTYSSENWTMDWSHLEVFHKNNGADTYLLCYRKSDGRFRTYLIESQGIVVGPAITDETATANFDIVKVVHLDGSDHLFRHNSTSGHTHVRQLDDDGTWGPTVYDKIWNSGYLSFNFYTTGTGDTFILRYNWNTGDANILEFDSTVNGLDNTSIVLDSQWSLNWRIMRFFETPDGTFNFRYNPQNGWVRIQEVRANGTLGSIVMTSDNQWLRERSADGAFRPATKGWDTVEFYFGKNIVHEPIPPRAVASPPSAQTGNDESSFDSLPPSFPRPIVLQAVKPVTTFTRGEVQLHWVGSQDVLYFIEKSSDLVHWTPDGLLGGGEEPMQWSRSLPEEDPAIAGQDLARCFYRVRTFERAPDEPAEEQPGDND